MIDDRELKQNVETLIMRLLILPKSAPPDRLRSGYADAMCQFSCYYELGVLQAQAAGEPSRYVIEIVPHLELSLKPLG